MTALSPPADVEQPARRRKKKVNHNGEEKRAGVLVHFAAYTIVLVSLSPLIWMLVSAFRKDSETNSYPPSIIPKEPTLENFVNLLERSAFVQYFLNSLVAATVTTAIVVPLAIGSAYALGHMKDSLGRFAGLAEHGSLLAYMLPAILLAVPTARVINAMGLSDTLTGLIIVYLASFFPLALWLLRSYIAGILGDLEDAAMIDGATRFQTIYMIVIPQIIPGIVATAIFTFNAAWSEYLFASVLLQSGDRMTVTGGVAMLIGDGTAHSWGELMAAGVLVGLPVIVMSILLQKHLVTVQTDGAVKG